MNRKTPTENYFLEFYDDFNNYELDSSKWIPYYLPQWSNRHKAKAIYKIQDSILTLSIDKNQNPWCPEFNGNIRVSSIQTGLFSGKLCSSQGQHHFSKDLFVREEQETLKLYTPKFGYFEFKARCNIEKNHVVAFWMIGFEKSPQNSAEICIFELKGGNIGENSAKIGYGIHPFGDNSITNEFYEDEFNINVFDWNTYGVEWLQNKINFYINNNLIKTIYQSPQYEMQLMVNIYDLENINNINSTFDIDYIAGYSLHK